MAYHPSLSVSDFKALIQQCEHNYKWISYTPLFDLNNDLGLDAFILGSSMEDACWMTSKVCDQFLRLVIKRNPNDTLFFERVQIAPGKFAIRAEQRL